MSIQPSVGTLGQVMFVVSHTALSIGLLRRSVCLNFLANTVLAILVERGADNFPLDVFRERQPRLNLFQEKLGLGNGSHF